MIDRKAEGSSPGRSGGGIFLLRSQPEIWKRFAGGGNVVVADISTEIPPVAKGQLLIRAVAQSWVVPVKGVI